MRIQGLIRRLEQLKKKHGNLEVYSWDKAKEDWNKPEPKFDPIPWKTKSGEELGKILRVVL